MSQKLRIAVVGLGFGGHFPWHKHPHCVVTALCDTNEAALDRGADFYGCSKRYTCYQDLLSDSNVDAIALFTPAPLHASQSIAALRSGKHVCSAVPAGITLDECEELLRTVEDTGLTYMMAETSYWRQGTISARKFYQEGEFGEIFYCEAAYHHAGLDSLFWDSEGNRTWRHGFPPMLYPTHCTAFLVGVTGERLTEVVCVGWGDDSPVLKDNIYNNPFWNENAFFKTERGHGFRVAIYWHGAHLGAERAEWYGDKMSFFMGHPNWDWKPVIVRTQDQTGSANDSSAQAGLSFEVYDQPLWWKTDMLPESLRQDSEHDGSHAFIVHEFVDSIVNNHRPAIDIYEALNYTVPGIIAHKSALEGGTLLKIPVYGNSR
jgi:predicted dehydrogenase